MKHFNPFIIFLLAGLVAGCSKSSTGNDAPTTTSASTAAPVVAAVPPSTAPAAMSPAIALPTATTTMPSAANSDPATAQPLAQVKHDVQKTMQDLKDYSYDQKDEFFKAIQSDLDELNQEMSQFTAKIARASDAAKATAKPKLDLLLVQMSKLNIEVDEAKTATESIWGDAKIKVQRAYDETKQTFHDVADWVAQQPTS